MNPLVNSRLYTFSGVPGNTLSIATSEKCSPFLPHSHIVAFGFTTAAFALATTSLVLSGISRDARGEGSADDAPGRASRHTL